MYPYKPVRNALLLIFGALLCSINVPHPLAVVAQNVEPLSGLSYFENDNFHRIWNDAKRGGTDWTNNLPNCPKTVDDALLHPDFIDKTVEFSTGRYHPGGVYDFRTTTDWSEISQNTNGQQCVYDGDKKLITGGSAAGTPDLWNPSINTYTFTQHLTFDVEPWDVLGWELYAKYWPPNNGNGAEINEVTPIAFQRFGLPEDPREPLITRLPEAIVGEDYNIIIPITVNDPASKSLNVSVDGGTIPDGIDVKTTEYSYLQIFGTPEEAASGWVYTFTVRVTDSTNVAYRDYTGSQVYSIAVLPAEEARECDTVLEGTSGRDRYSIPAGASGLWCINDSGGNDTLSFFQFDSSITINLGIYGVQFVGGDLYLKTNGTIEHVNGTNFDDFLVGNNENNSFEGFDGDDELFGLGGIDDLQGGKGSDNLHGGDGNDYLVGDKFQDNGDDIISGGEGNDYLKGFGGNDILNGDGGDDNLIGDGGDDILIGGDGNDELLDIDGSDEFTGGSGYDKALGYNHNTGDVAGDCIESPPIEPVGGQNCVFTDEGDVTSEPETPNFVPPLQTATPTPVITDLSPSPSITPSPTATATMTPMAVPAAAQNRLIAPGVGDVCQYTDGVTFEAVYKPPFDGEGFFPNEPGSLFFGPEYEYWVSDPGTIATFVLNNSPFDQSPELVRGAGGGDAGGYIGYLGRGVTSPDTLVFTFIEEDVEHYLSFDYSGSGVHEPGFMVGIFIDSNLSPSQASAVTLTVYCGSPDDGVVRNPSAGATSIPALVNCPGLLPSRIIIGEQGRVVPGPGQKNRVRREPSTDSEQVASISAGETFIVLDGPTCAEGYAWWQVDFRGTVGWTVEGDSEDYWIEPLASTTNSQVASANVSEDICRVEFSGAVNRRAGPGTSFDVVTQSTSGEVLEVVAYEISTSNFRWWQLVDGTWVREDVVNTIGSCGSVVLSGEESTVQLTASATQVNQPMPTPSNTPAVQAVEASALSVTNMDSDIVLPDWIEPESAVYLGELTFNTSSVYVLPQISTSELASDPNPDRYHIYTFKALSTDLIQVRLDSNQSEWFSVVGIFGSDGDEDYVGVNGPDAELTGPIRVGDDGIHILIISTPVNNTGEDVSYTLTLDLLQAAATPAPTLNADQLATSTFSLIDFAGNNICETEGVVLLRYVDTPESSSIGVRFDVSAGTTVTFAIVGEIEPIGGMGGDFLRLIDHTLAEPYVSPLAKSGNSKTLTYTFGQDLPIEINVRWGQGSSNFAITATCGMQAWTEVPTPTPVVTIPPPELSDSDLANPLLPVSGQWHELLRSSCLDNPFENDALLHVLGDGSVILVTSVDGEGLRVYVRTSPGVYERNTDISIQRWVIDSPDHITIEYESTNCVTNGQSELVRTFNDLIPEQAPQSPVFSIGEAIALDQGIIDFYSAPGFSSEVVATGSRKPSGRIIDGPVVMDDLIIGTVWWKVRVSFQYTSSTERIDIEGWIPATVISRQLIFPAE